MNQRQRDMILGVIQTNCKAVGVYTCSDGECIIGGMARAAGIDLPKSTLNSVSLGNMYSFSIKLESFFGLTYEQLRELQLINDRNGNLSNRRYRLTQYVNSFPVEA